MCRGVVCRVLLWTYLDWLIGHLVVVGVAADNVATSVSLLGLQLLVGARWQASLRERQKHLRWGVHGHDYGIVVPRTKPRANLLYVVQALGGACSIAISAGSLCGLLLLIDSHGLVEEGGTIVVVVVAIVIVTILICNWLACIVIARGTSTLKLFVHFHSNIYFLSLILIHHFTLFSLVVFNYNKMLLIVRQTFYSSAFTFLVCLLIYSLFSSKEAWGKYYFTVLLP